MILIDCFIKNPNASIKLILRYARERCIQQERDTAYRIYVTDCLRGILENTAKIGGGTYRKDRYYDVLKPEPKKTEKTSEQVKADILAEFEKLGGGKK